MKNNNTKINTIGYRPSKIGVNFCGGCNPRIDRGKIATTVANNLPGEFTIFYNAADADFFIYLSGCTANCAQKYSKTGGVAAIVVSGELFNETAVNENQLPELILRKISEYSDRFN